MAAPSRPTQATSPALAHERESSSACATRLGISREAAELFHGSSVIDLHIDSFIWQRLFGYDIGQRHGRGLFCGRFYSQVDLPRLRQVGLDGATWVITTNPWRHSIGKRKTFAQNLRVLKATLARHEGELEIVQNTSQFHAAVAQGKHAAFLGIQGGNCLDAGLDALDELQPQQVLRVTLVHLSSSKLGATSAPSLGPKGLTVFGRSYVQRLNEMRILVDLAHIHPQGFDDALEASDPSLPVVVTHTGVDGVHPHWRNLSDRQIRSIADRGGTIGVMYHCPFLGDGWLGGSAGRVVDHMQHIIQVAGDDYVSLGSDWDGAIVTPRDMRTCLELPRLVQAMLERRFSVERIQKILGENFLRVLTDLRG